MRKILFPLLLLLVGCHVDLPKSDSAIVSYRDGCAAVPLKAESIQSFYDWLKRNGNGWESNIVSYADNADQLGVCFYNSSREVASIIVSGNMVIINAGSQYVKFFPSDGICALRLMLGGTGISVPSIYMNTRNGGTVRDGEIHQ